MKIKKNDQVLIISGDDKGKKGKVLKVSSKTNRILVEGVNMVKKHIKPRKSGQKGQTVQAPNFLAVSKVKIICSKCGKSSRIGFEIGEKVKNRICKKCGEKI
ncbi:MAG: 50S ribosomal protein L24 [Candidatus Paceibacterota bacterium]|jgi:large subunit ribosomal protein L24